MNKIDDKLFEDKGHSSTNDSFQLDPNEMNEFMEVIDLDKI